MADVGKRLKKLRELAGVSQAAVAAHVGFDRAFLSMIEAGHRNVSPADAEKIEAYLQREQTKKNDAFTRMAMA